MEIFFNVFANNDPVKEYEISEKKALPTISEETTKDALEKVREGRTSILRSSDERKKKNRVIVNEEKNELPSVLQPRLQGEVEEFSMGTQRPFIDQNGGKRRRI